MAKGNENAVAFGCRGFQFVSEPGGKPQGSIFVKEP
jgi:hypothetical protein